MVGEMEQIVVSDSGQVPQRKHEVTVVDETYFAGLKARYRERVPNCDSYFATHDFSFWRMRSIKKVRYIAGFGRICWFKGAHLLKTSSQALNDAAGPAIAHMNAEHADALALIFQAHYQQVPENIRMTKLESRGFFMRHDGSAEPIYTSFGREIDERRH